jgi:WD40 repeat protein
MPGLNPCWIQKLILSISFPYKFTAFKSFHAFVFFFSYSLAILEFALLLLFSMSTVLLAQTPKGPDKIPTESQKPQPLYTFQVPGKWVQALAISPDGRTLAAGGALGNIVQLRDLWFGGLELAPLDMKNEQVRAIAFSPDGRLLAIGLGRAGSKGVVRLVDAHGWKVVGNLEGLSGSLISKLSFSPDGKRLACGSTDVKVFDVATGRILHSFKGGTSKIVPVDVSPKGQVFAHGSQDSGNPEPTVIILRDLQSGQIIHTLRGHTGFVESVAFSPDGRLLASGGWDRTIRLWDATTGRQIFSLEGHSGNAQPIAFTPDGTMLASAQEDSRVKFWDVKTGQTLITFIAHQGHFVSSIAISSDRRTLCTGSTDRTVRAWELSEILALAGKGPRSPVDAKPQIQASIKTEPEVKIDGVFLGSFEKPDTPLNNPRRGQKVKMMMRYTVSGGRGGAPADVVEFRRIFYRDEQVIETKDERQLETGSYETFRVLTLPEQTPSGDYKLQGIIRIGGRGVSREFSFKLE